MKKLLIFNACLILLFILPLLPRTQVITPTSDTSKVNIQPFNKLSDISSNLQLDKVHPLTKGNNILIADIDTGLDPMFEKNVFHNPNETSDGVDNDHNGFTDDMRGWNFVADTNNTYDDSYTWHGTSVVSVILSIAPDAQILPIKYIAADNTIADYSQLIKINEALTYTSLFRPDIIVMPFNFYKYTTPSSTLNILQSLQSNGTIILVSSGNCDSNCGYIREPANNRFVYAIGSIDTNNVHSDFSAYGTELDFSLYGQNVAIQYPGSSGDYDNGTSYSVAMAGGLFALYKNLYMTKENSFNLTDFILSIQLSAKNLGSANLYGYGLPQIYISYKALSDTNPPNILSYSIGATGDLHLSISDESGISGCKIQEKATSDKDFSSISNCNSPNSLPMISNNNELSYTINLVNVSSFMTLKLSLLDLNDNNNSFVLHLSLSLITTPAITSIDNSSNSTQYVVGIKNESTTFVVNDSTISILSDTNSSDTSKTTPFLELFIFLFSFMFLLLKRKSKSN